MDEKKIIAALFFIFLSFSVLCEEGEKRKEQSILEQWRETLLYGISEEVLDVIKDIRRAKETSLNSEMVEVLAGSVNTEVRIDILEYFTSLEFNGAEDIGLSFLSESEDLELESLFIISIINYLAAIKSEGLRTRLIKYVENEDDELSMTALRAIGKISDTSKTEYLLEKLEDPEFPSLRKPTVILVLGDLKATKAVPALIEIINDTFEDKTWRMYACDSLGKIGDDRAIPVLKKAFSEKDALIRAYAAHALASFDLSSVMDILIQGLKDSNWKVRLHCTKALANKDAGAAVHILQYKAKKDPVNNIRIEAVNTLGEIGTKECFDFIRELFAKKNENLEIRKKCSDVLIEKDLDGSLGTIRRVIAESWNASSHEFKIVDICALKLSTTESPLLKDVFKKFLESPNMNIRIYGIRGIALNKFIEFKEIITKISEKDPVKTVRREALAALTKM